MALFGRHDRHERLGVFGDASKEKFSPCPLLPVLAGFRQAPGRFASEAAQRGRLLGELTV